MVINSLLLKDFRNYKSFKSDFSPGINFIYGKNGQGKTNLIESFYILTHLKSFRTAHLKELCSFGKDLSLIQSELTKQGVFHEVSINLQKNQKIVQIDQKKVNYTSDYIKNFFSILFSPDQLLFFKEYPLERRNYFDRILVLVDQQYFDLIKNFNKIKKHKGALLRSRSIREISVWNQLLADIIPEISESRQSLVKKINKKMSVIFTELTGRKDKLELWYKSDFEGKADLDQAAIAGFLNEKLEAELAKGFLCFGPHKDQFWMTLNERKDKETFSQGEYRISFLALQFSIHTMISELLGFSPIILLDDIFSELDQQVFIKTIEYIDQQHSQVFITSAMIPEEYRKKGNSYLINKGRLLA
ncbi:DNA replication and repair protein RecF [bacterium]|nr:DNA replication and repair protein RecF [bacterium]